MSFCALETPEPMVPRKERIPAKFVPGLNLMTYLIGTQGHGALECKVGGSCQGWILQTQS